MNEALPPDTPPPRARRAHEQGFSLVEAIIAVAVVLVGVLALVTTLLSAESLREDTDASFTRYVQQEQLLERVRGGDAAEMFEELQAAQGRGELQHGFQIEPAPEVLTRHLPQDGTSKQRSEAEDLLLPLRITVQTGSASTQFEYLVRTR